MGYTTKFAGKFALSRQLTMDEYNILQDIAEDPSCNAANEFEDGVPDSYCQWVPTRNGRSIEWDGGEKFYDYVEWLQWIICGPLATWGIDLSGEVTYSGEDTDDRGILRIDDSCVEQINFKEAAKKQKADRKAAIANLIDAAQSMGDHYQIPADAFENFVKFYSEK
jgi:hypothetical protein